MALDAGLSLMVWLQAASIGLAALLAWRVLRPETCRSAALGACPGNG